VISSRSESGGTRSDKVKHGATYLAWVSSTSAANSSGSVSLSTAIASPLAPEAEPEPADTVTLDSAALASSRSLDTRAMTLTAASCW
jgi:hypothetical protein